MENTDFNKFPESEKIFPKKENSQSEERKSSEREKVFLEIEGQNIEAEKSYFEYPERIQKETLIQGYTKYKINKDEMRELAGIITMKRAHETEVTEHQARKEVYNKIFNILSGGNFPSKTYNHQIQVDGGYGKSSQEQMYSDRFILSKLTNINTSDYGSIKHRYAESVIAITNDQGEVSFVGEIKYIHDSGTYLLKKFVEVRGDGDMTPRLIANFEKEKKITCEQFNNLIKDKIVCNTMSGIYTQYGDTFASLDYNPSGGRLQNKYPVPTFGFNPKEPPFKDYLEKIKNTYSKLPLNIISRKNMRGLNHLLDNKSEKTKMLEEIIPVMTGNTGLPALRWGHAKYAVVPTEKNFNFLIIDHLPVKEKNDPSDSEVEK